MPALIGGKLISPTPLVTISRQSQLADDGTDLGQTYVITLHGSLVAVPPGGTAVAEPARLGVLLAKQAELTENFSHHGDTFEIYSPDGTNVVRCNPKVVSIEFAEGIWVEKTEYTIVLETPTLYANDFVPSELVTEIRDQWQIEEAGFTTDLGSVGLKPVWQLSHTVSATGRLSYDVNGNLTPPWEQARDWVINRLSTSNFGTAPFDTQAELNLIAGGQAYNHTRTEDVDIVTGSFTVTEKWLMARGSPATETYTVSVRRTPEDAVPTSVNISGTIQGLAIDLNRLETRIDSAISYFNNYVKNNLFTRASNAVPGVTLSNYGVSGTLDYNYAEGTISYNYDFSDKPTPIGTDFVYDNYTVSKKISMDEIETTVTVQGTITGLLGKNETPSLLLKYQRAKFYWDTIGRPGLLSKAGQSGVAGLKPASLQGSVDFNISEGIITYNYDFNNRPDDLARNDYTMTMRSTKEESRTTISIDGTITGLRATDDDPITAKYTNALAFWSTWEPMIPVKASTYVPGIVLNPEPSRTRGDNPRQGVINYTYEYNTDRTPSISGALTENVTIADNNQADVFAAIPVLGRKAGPVLQDIGSKKEKSRTATLEVVMKLGMTKPSTDGVMNSYKPSGSKVFVDRDEESWMENTGHYNRTITWVYE